MARRWHGAPERDLTAWGAEAVTRAQGFLHGLRLRPHHPAAAVPRRRTTPATRFAAVLLALGALAGVSAMDAPTAHPCRHAALGDCLGEAFAIVALPYAANAFIGALTALALGAVLVLAWRAMGSVPDGPGPRRPAIPERVRHEVWRRDGGTCVDCGSRARLEFDHIVPFSRGGSGTARNLELRCEPCNRRKGARI